jgi:hypothetical protein
MEFCGVSMRFYDDPVNQSVPTEANRGLTSYKPGSLHLPIRKGLVMQLNLRGTQESSAIDVTCIAHCNAVCYYRLLDTKENNALGNHSFSGCQILKKNQAVCRNRRQLK